MMTSSFGSTTTLHSQHASLHLKRKRIQHYDHTFSVKWLFLSVILHVPQAVVKIPWKASNVSAVSSGIPGKSKGVDYTKKLALQKRKRILIGWFRSYILAIHSFFLFGFYKIRIERYNDCPYKAPFFLWSLWLSSRQIFFKLLEGSLQI